jgi:integrase
MARKKALPSSLTHKEAGPRAPERWVFRGRNGIDPRTGEPDWDVVTFYNEDEARAYDSDHTTRTARKSLTGRPAGFTVAELVAEFTGRPERAYRLDRGTRRRQIDLLQPFGVAHGAMPVRHLRRNHIETLAVSLLTGTCRIPTASEIAASKTRTAPRKWCTKNVNVMVSLITEMLDYLRDDGFLDNNQGALIEPYIDRPHVSEAPEDLEEPKAAYDQVEVETILTTAGMRSPVVYMSCVLAFMGFRKGEIVGLRWDLINLDEGYMWVAEQRKRNRDRPADRAADDPAVVVDTPKTRDGKRKLPIPPVMVDLLKVYRRWQLEQHMASGRRFGVGGQPPTHVIVRTDTGVGVCPDFPYQNWGVVIEAAGVQYLKPHCARDTCATLLEAYAPGVTAVDIGAWLGHAPKDSAHGPTSASRVTHGYIQEEAKAKRREKAAIGWDLVFGPIVTRSDMFGRSQKAKDQVRAI